MQYNSFHDVNILYVEDDSCILKPLEPSLKKIFNKLYTAPDGVEGLSLYKKLYQTANHIDIIITDIEMPNMNDINMMKEIKKLNPSVDFIITTARNDRDFLLDAIELNANHVTLKPMKVQSLLNQIKQIIDSHIESVNLTV